MRFVKKIPWLQLLTQKRLGQKMPFSQHLLICYVRTWFKMELNQWKALIFHTLLFISTLAQINCTLSAFMLMCLNLHSVGEIMQKVCKFLRCFVKKITKPGKIFRDHSSRRSRQISCTGCLKKTHFQKAVGATVHWLNQGTLCAWKIIFWSFLTKNKPDLAFPSHFMIKFSPTALNFG